MIQKLFYIILTVVSLLALTACGVLSPGNNIDQDYVATQSQVIIDQGRKTATVAAELTRAAQTQNAPTATLQPTATQIPPTATQTPTATVTNTPLPTFTPRPTFTPLPTSTPLAPVVVVGCNQATFVSDISIPDGTILPPSSKFTKTWRLKNSGTCTWSTKYSLVFYSGEKMGGSTLNMPANVAPGQTVDLAVDLTTPGTNGKYRSSWILQNASGESFGVGANNGTIYASIVVQTGAAVYLKDFAGLSCSAEWTSGAGTLPCPGSDGDANGFVLVNGNSPVLENGATENEPVLVMQPQAITDGSIRGKYPSYKVVSGDHFKAILGCSNKADKCDINFQLSYQIGSDAVKSLSSWHEVYDGKLTKADVDLTSLAGQNVAFILTVNANGAMNQDRALWLAPRIVHP